MKVSGGVRSCLAVEFFDGPDEPSTRPQGPTLRHFRSSDLKKEEEYLQQSWERCLNDDAVVIPHRIIRLYDQKGDCTKIIHTNVLHREDDESDADSTPDQESANADDTVDLECQEEYPDVANQGESGKDIDEGESEEEIHVTGLEEVVTSVVKDLSIDYTDNEDGDDYEVSEPQHLAAAKRNQQNTSSHSLTKSRSPQVKKNKTNLCTNIVKIVGESDCLYKLDTARQNLKEHPTNDFYKRNYETFLHLFI